MQSKVAHKCNAGGHIMASGLQFVINERPKKVAWLEDLAAIRPLTMGSKPWLECGEYASESRALTYKSIEGHTEFLVGASPTLLRVWYASGIFSV
ncbi:jg25679 [Pararge aegeria aegeria]|uniref:Jg25679 protein n=1 Tax=Pararge aegeria aegeria TaxID=348720 RepID=A0A8S4QVF3_9NEOP|nr:jg25679 [Pararge aegeria aegeria]